MTSSLPKHGAAAGLDLAPAQGLPSESVEDELLRVRRERDELLRRVEELDATTLRLEKEVVKRGVKLNCAQVALARAQIAFDEISQQREEAVQDIAHDLKTPLTSIRGAAQNVIDGIVGPVDDSVREYLEIIRDQSDRLVSTVNWLVQAIRIENEQMKLEAETCNAAQIVEEAATRLRPLAEEKGLKLCIDAQTQQATLDAPKFHQIVENLVGNAIKFTQPGGTVSVSLSRNETSLVLRVSDTGVGMSEDTRSNLFRRYFRATETEGSGVGLVIVKNLVRLHRGGLEIQSELGQGSTFEISIPQACAQ